VQKKPRQKLGYFGKNKEPYFKMKQFEIKETLAKKLNIYLLLQIINKIPFLFSREHQNASALMGLAALPAGKTLSIRTLTSICIYASKTISLHKQEESQTVLESIKYIKHKVIVLLMLDAGLQFQKPAA
jgi:hypothetical protein